MDESRIKDVSSLLSEFFDEEKLRRGGRYAQFFESWRAVVGERLAAHSRVVDLDKGILIIEADHPGWIQLLQMRQTHTLDALANRFPDLTLRGIAFRLAGVEYHRQKTPLGRKTAEELPGEPEPSEEEAFQGDDATDIGPPAENETKDPEFMAALSSLKKAIQGGKKK